jgi:hypothetical protein
MLKLNNIVFFALLTSTVSLISLTKTNAQSNEFIPDYILHTQGQPDIAIFISHEKSFALGCPEIRNVWSAIRTRVVESPEFNSILSNYPVVADLPCDGSIIARKTSDEGPGLLLIKHRDGTFYRHYVDSPEFFSALRTGPMVTVDGTSFRNQYPNRGIDFKIAKDEPPEPIPNISRPSLPIHINTGQETVGSHWYMETNATVSKNGRIDATTKTKSCQTRGFTGGVWIALLDQDGNFLYVTDVKRYGVNGKLPFGGCEERTEQWNETVPSEIINQVSAAVVQHARSPRGVTKEDVYRAVELGAEIYRASQEGQ